ncbi:hypothetical protein SBRCBS47491_000066 [Sporothrix bragantina]|uniref:Uncharacterized protein n=1 Tax=Sporothrix bragantina TaxID=671064 RepID=A0ABP0ALC0_9PEZI
MMATQSTTATMQPHDELAALLARNLTLGSIPITMPAVPVEQPKIVYSISQHYHHSAHVIKPAAAVEQPAPEQPHHQETPEQVLMQNGIDPNALTPVQLALFKMSAPDRREYLLQLWRICPPTRNAAEYNAVAAGAAWDTMEAEMEKEIASSQLRVQQQTQQQQQQQQPEQQQSFQQSFPQEQPVPSTTEAATQSSDGRWLQSTTQSYMEPYMASGYEELARREYMASNSPPSASFLGGASPASIPRTKYAYDSANPHVAFGVQLRHTATDPVYANRLSTTTAPSRASWPQQHQSAMDMENQYGALMAMRDGCEMEM